MQHRACHEVYDGMFYACLQPSGQCCSDAHIIVSHLGWAAMQPLMLAALLFVRLHAIVLTACCYCS
jgi:hypothetical protein